MPDAIKRSEDMVTVAFFLSKFGEKRERRTAYPPRELQTTSWKIAYTEFFASLAEGRMPTTFRNSLKNARDVFDAHVQSGRVGWREAGAERPPAELPSMHKRVWKKWSGSDRAHLWAQVKIFADVSVSDLHERTIDDIETQAGEHQERKVITEGGKKVYISSASERDPRARAEAINLHGTTCMACGFNFGAIYGSWGEDYIEVHHLVPLSASTIRRETDPTSDLVVLCANCHRMTHRKKNIVLSLDELRKKIRKIAVRTWTSNLRRND